MTRLKCRGKGTSVDRPINNIHYESISDFWTTMADNIQIYKICIEVCEFLMFSDMIVCIAPLCHIHDQSKSERCKCTWPLYTAHMYWAYIVSRTRWTYKHRSFIKAMESATAHPSNIIKKPAFALSDPAFTHHFPELHHVREEIDLSINVNIQSLAWFTVKDRRSLAKINGKTALYQPG